jgi:Skp family chaperone for outer membrane proteins
MATLRVLFAACALAATAPIAAQNGAPADATAGGAQRPAAQLLIGTVDPVKAIENYPRSQEEQKRLDGLRKEAQAAVEAIRTKIDEINARRKLVAEGSDERQDLDFEFAAQNERLTMLAKRWRAQLDRENEKYQVAMYDDLERAVETVARNRGVLLVLRVHAKPELEPSESDPVGLRLRLHERRTVLYGAEEIDLTPAVIRVLQTPLGAKPVDAKDGKDGAAAKPSPTTDPGAAKTGGGNR